MWEIAGTRTKHDLLAHKMHRNIHFHFCLKQGFASKNI